jgi:hypothetical protein
MPSGASTQPSSIEARPTTVGDLQSIVCVLVRVVDEGLGNDRHARTR